MFRPWIFRPWTFRPRTFSPGICSAVGHVTNYNLEQDLLDRCCGAGRDRLWSQFCWVGWAAAQVFPPRPALQHLACSPPRPTKFRSADCVPHTSTCQPTHHPILQDLACRQGISVLCNIYLCPSDRMPRNHTDIVGP